MFSRENRNSTNAKVPDPVPSLPYPTPTHAHLFARRASASLNTSTVRYDPTDSSTTVMNPRFQNPDNPVGPESPTTEVAPQLRNETRGALTSQSMSESNVNDSSGTCGVVVPSEGGSSDTESHRRRGPEKEKSFLTPISTERTERKKRLRLSFKSLRSPKHTVQIRSWSENDVPVTSTLSPSCNQDHVILTRHSSNLELYQDSNHNQSSESNISVPSTPSKEFNKSPISSKSFFSFLGSHTNSNNHSSSSSHHHHHHHHQSSHRQKVTTTPTLEVKETHTMYKDYDPTTGNKIINKYMLIKELGRGVHGKVKLGQDLESGELVVSTFISRKKRKKNKVL